MPDRVVLVPHAARAAGPTGWSTRIEFANAILEIFHNRQRRYSSLGMLSPIEFETRQPHPPWHEEFSSPTPQDQGQTTPIHPYGAGGAMGGEPTRSCVTGAVRPVLSGAARPSCGRCQVPPW
jgi:hypothetical protein